MKLYSRVVSYSRPSWFTVAVVSSKSQSASASIVQLIKCDVIYEL